MSKRVAVRRRAGGLVMDSVFKTLPHVGRLHPRSRPERHGLEVIRDVPYRDTGHPERPPDDLHL